MVILTSYKIIRKGILDVQAWRALGGVGFLKRIWLIFEVLLELFCWFPI